jgi:hypothetical protein
VKLIPVDMKSSPLISDAETKSISLIRYVREQGCIHMSKFPQACLQMVPVQCRVEFEEEVSIQC